jgi:hypothetical protein
MVEKPKFRYQELATGYNLSQFHPPHNNFLNIHRNLISLSLQNDHLSTRFPAKILYAFLIPQNRDSIVGTATAYGLDDRGVGVRVSVGSRIFSSPSRPDRFWAHPAFYPMGTGSSFPGGKVAKVCS